MKKEKSYNVNQKILSLALPNIISNITVPLLSMVDLAIVGRLGDSSYIGAIAIGATIFNFVYWAFGFLRMGTSGFAAQAYGARSFNESAKILFRAMSIAILISLILILLQKPIFSMAASMLNTPSKSYDLVVQYFYVRIWAAPATLSLYVFKGWFIGMQNSKTPMYIAIVINIVNIVTSIAFVTIWDMGISGVALGTVIAQYSGLILFIFITKKYYYKVLKYIDFRNIFDSSSMLRFFNINRDIFLRTVCLIVIFTFFTSASSKMGETTLAVNALLLQLFTLFSYIMDGFAYAGESLVGRYYGAGNISLLKRCVNYIIVWGVVLGVFFTISYSLFLTPILSIFTDDHLIFTEAQKYIWWIVAVPFAGFFAFIFDGILVGMTHTKIMRNVIFLAVAVFFLIYYTTVEIIGNSAIWLSFIAFLLIRGVGQWLMYRYRIVNK